MIAFNVCQEKKDIQISDRVIITKIEVEIVESEITYLFYK